MKIRKYFSDSLVYTLFCLATMGVAFVLRVIISQAIRMALKEDWEK